MEEMNFTFDQRLIIELGRELVSKDEIALSELVKNSYDADASIVEIHIDKDRISIADNGTGMSMDTIRFAWLVIGTNNKKRHTQTQSRRRVLGEKGIGRLSAFRLGNVIEIRTKSAEDKLIELKIKLPNDDVAFNPAENGNLSTGLTVQVSTGDNNISFPGYSKTGTVILITALRDTWDDERINALQAILSRLIHPFDKSIQGFSMSLNFNNKIIDLEPPEKIKNPHYSIDAEVDSDGRITGSVSYLGVNGKSVEEKIEGTIDLKGFRNNEKVGYPTVDNGGCGQIKFRMYAWDRDNPDFRGMGKTLDYFTGCYLMRNDFLVTQPKTDWLGLNIRRVQNPTMRLSTNQIVGAVYIESDVNKNLKDKTDREGLIDNEAFYYLKQTVYILMSKLEEKRYKARRSKKLSKGSALFDIMDTRYLREISKDLPDNVKQSVLNLADDVDRRREELEELILGRDRMASAGLIAAEFIHSGRNALVPIVDGYRYIERRLDDVPDEIRKMITSMVVGGKHLSSLFDRMVPYMRFRARSETPIHLNSIIDMLSDLYAVKLRESKIKLIMDLDPQLSFFANQTDILILLTNFLVNSIYWAPKGNNPDGVPKIRISARSNEERVIIEFQDSGPGVQEEFSDEIFELGFSLKDPPGTGIGLAVNTDIVNIYGGKIDLERTSEMGGAKFTVVLPRRREET